MRFKYKALDSAGEQCSGQIEAASARAARDALREKSLQPIELRESVQPSIAVLEKVQQQRGLPQRVRQLATLVSAGIPLEEALRNLAQHKQSERSRQDLLALARALREGQSFQRALASQPHNYSPLFCAMVAVGERSGRLDQVLVRLADYQERSRQISQKVQLALIYPALLILVSCAVITGMMLWVVPKLVGQFESRDIALPLLTRAVMAFSDFLAYSWFLLPLIPLLCWFAWRYSSRGALQLKRDRQCLRLPLLGSVWQLNDMARFSRTLSITVASGLPLLDALAVASKTMTNSVLYRAVLEVGANVREGRPMARSMLDTGVFPDVFIQMVASGERSGGLAPLLQKVAEHQEQSLEEGVSTTLALLEPLLILLMGGLVFAIVLAVLLPVMQLNSFAGL
ncbi:MAG: type II secretion system F family protein [Pseudomonadales bacterium]